MAWVLLSFVIGAAAGALGVVLCRRFAVDAWAYSVMLALLPFFYALFAWSAGAVRVGLLELVVGLPWLLVGLGLLLRDVSLSAAVLGIFWILHAVFDMSHGVMGDNPGLPSWYPAWCAGVDFVVGGYLLWLARRLPNRSIRSATAAPRVSAPLTR